jgi:DNA-binding CsgD family transcriptional regulator
VPPRTGAITIPSVPGLTMRERQILPYVVAGHTYAEIAGTLFVSVKTVSVHVSNMLRKTGLRNRAELSRYARRMGAGPGRDESGDHDRPEGGPPGVRQDQ